MKSETFVLEPPRSGAPEDLRQGLRRHSCSWGDVPDSLTTVSSSHRDQQESSCGKGSVSISKSSLSGTTSAPNISTQEHPTTSTETNAAGEGHHCHHSSEFRFSQPQDSQRSLNYNASPPEHLYQPSSSCFLDPKRVPGTNQFIYPYANAAIRPEFQRRYPQLVNFFKQAVDVHKRLKRHASQIDYQLRVCGSMPSNAVASIIIFCTGSIFKELKLLLSSRYIRRQYELEKISGSINRSTVPDRTQFQTPVSATVPFKIVYWRESTTPTQRRSATEQVVAQNPSLITMCGSLVRYGNRTSTLGLLVSMDSKLYGLTVDHLFKNQCEEEQLWILEEQESASEQCEIEDLEDNQDNWSWVDDVTYDDIDDDQRVINIESATSEIADSEMSTSQPSIQHPGISMKGHRMDAIRKTDSSTTYLDWALIEFDDGYFKKPNVFFSDDDPNNPNFPTQLSSDPKVDGTPVFMISGVSGTRKGVLFDFNSYIGGKQGENLCPAWNMVLSDSTCESTFIYISERNIWLIPICSYN
jgi:hypothetical protein